MKSQAGDDEELGPFHLLDYLHLGELATACERARRWEFLLVGAPLRIAGGTGSPLNPIAIL